ncbi:hypothetical protein O5559_29470, partial [Escherichia coli]|nr:hypothetical protein [Escherichia coli]
MLKAAILNYSRGLAKQVADLYWLWCRSRRAAFRRTGDAWACGYEGDVLISIDTGSGSISAGQIV